MKTPPIAVVIAFSSLAVACDTGGVTEHAPDTPILRVCEDPNNLPFSNDRREGFENRLADIVAKASGARVEYTWWAQRRGFLRNTLNARLCDVVMGLPANVEMALVTRPYYRSTYVFVSRRDAGLRPSGFDDPILRRLRIGVQMIGDDFANAPPAHALSSRGLVKNIVGYSVYGDYREPNPPARIVEAVARRDVDIAVAWGPLAGYFASRQATPLELTPVSPQVDVPFLPFVFDISMAVRREDIALRDRLDRVLIEHRHDIDRVLAEYHVPRLDHVTGPSTGEPSVSLESSARAVSRGTVPPPVKGAS